MIMEHKCLVFRKRGKEDILSFLAKLTDDDFNGKNEGCINGKGSIIEKIVEEDKSKGDSLKAIIEDVLIKAYYISSYYKDFKYSVINRRNEVIVSISYIY